MFDFEKNDFWNDPLLVLGFLSTLLVIIFIRYFAFAYFYQAILARFTKRNQNIFSLKKIQIRREIKWSFLSSLVFTLFSGCCFWAYQQGMTEIYDEVLAYPLWYFCVSPFLLIVLYETYYYWLHRWMHLPSIFKIVHKVHHESLNPTVFTSFSFHPLEAILQFVFLPLVIFIIPMHFIILLTVLMLMTVSAVINHSGVEIFHKKFILNNLIGSSHHDLHHTEFKTNFGLYFTWWDKCMKTESKKPLKNP